MRNKAIEISDEQENARINCLTWHNITHLVQPIRIHLHMGCCLTFLRCVCGFFFLYVQIHTYYEDGDDDADGFRISLFSSQCVRVRIYFASLCGAWILNHVHQYVKN